MSVSLLAALILIAQPAPQDAPEEPVAVEAEAEAEVQAAPAPAPAAEAEADAEADAEAEADAVADAEQEAQAPQEEEICRRRLVPSERVGQRHRVVTICRTREEWARGTRRR